MKMRPNKFILILWFITKMTFFLVWLVSCSWIIYLLYVSSNSFRNAIFDTPVGQSENFWPTINLLVKTGLISFDLFVISHFYHPFRNGINGNLNKVKLLSISGLIFIVVFQIETNLHNSLKIHLPRILKYVREPIELSGTGSMFPTIPKGKTNSPKDLARELVGSITMFPFPEGIVINNTRYLNHTISRGDIIEFRNAKTASISQALYDRESGFIKRVIGLPQDTLELRNGLVYINQQVISEPYIARARSTFGGLFLPDCKSITIPENQLFVMGDNRKGSGDSRHELGFVTISDVNYVLPQPSQKGYLDQHWRDTSRDTLDQAKIRLDKQKYLELINEKRLVAGIKPLKYQSRLESSAGKRGKVMLEYDDFSFNATRSGYTMEKAMADSNYSNIIWGEAIITGYYEAEELVENIFELSKWNEFMLNKDYQEFGVTEVEGNINNCPTQVVVQHLAGFIPPNYSLDVIISWKQTLTGLKNIQPGWQNLKQVPQYYDKYKREIDRINEIISLRIALIETIVIRMESNQWLTPQEQELAYQDETLAQEQINLADKLNKVNYL